MACLAGLKSRLGAAPRLDELVRSGAGWRCAVGWSRRVAASRRFDIKRHDHAGSYRITGLLGLSAGRGGVMLWGGVACDARRAGIAESLRPDDSISSGMIMQDRIESSGFLGRSAGWGGVVLRSRVAACDARRAGIAGSLRLDDSISSGMIMQDRIESSGV